MLNGHDQERRAHLKAQRDAEKDPQQCEAYALAARAGFDWYDTESAARRMAEHAAGEIIGMRGSLKDIFQGCTIMLMAEPKGAVRDFMLEVQRIAFAGLQYRRTPHRAMTPTHTGVHL